jgi:hypothetical protein
MELRRVAMTENEAIEKLHAYLECESRRAKIVSCNESCDDCELCYMQGTGAEHITSVKTAIKSLEEVQQYHQIGTVEECREAVEKQTAKKPDYEGDGFSDGQLVYDTWICPCCGKHYEVDCDRYYYCQNCGQHIDWSDEE